MDNVKGKMFTLVGIVLVIAVFFLVFWLLFYQESVYYTQIDNEKVQTLDSGDMRYEYSLEAYDKNGKSKTVTFKTSRELRDDAYLKLDVMITRGVKAWEEIEFKDMPKNVQERYNN